MKFPAANIKEGAKIINLSPFFNVLNRVYDKSKDSGITVKLVEIIQ